MSPCRLDHLVVTAPSLDAGAAWVRQALGVSPQPGGEHPRMGTHNRLLRLGDELYLEVIAINPAAPAPTRPRWFALDRLGSDAAPALSAWVVRTSNIQAAVSVCSEPIGAVEAMSRGALDWFITLSADGSAPLGGIGPALIEWRTAPHPASKLQEQGLSLAKLELAHPEPERVSRLLTSLRLDAPVTVSAAARDSKPRLVAWINTPHGLQVLSSAL
ncbi:MAG: VOC family protein [Candidatus Competibacter sp.]